MSFNPKGGLGPCACINRDAEIQVACALLRRVGFGPLSNPNGPGALELISGPLSPVGIQARDPLYLKLEYKMVWENGVNYTQTYTVDPEFADMTVLFRGLNDPANPDYTHTNVAPGWPHNPRVSFNHPGDPDAQHTYGLNVGPRNQSASIASDGLSAIVTWDPFDEYDGPTFVKHWYGGTQTVTLSVPYTFSQYADLATAMLAAISLQDGTLAPAKTYHIDESGIGYEMKLRYFSEFPKNRADADSNLFTNFIGVTKTRAAGFIFAANADLFIPDAWNTGWIGGLGIPTWFGLDLPHKSPVRYPLAANGLTQKRLVLSDTDPDYFPGNFLRGFGVPTQHSAEYIVSIKTSVRSKTSSLAATGCSMIYDPATDAMTRVASSLPDGAGEFIFEPADVGGIGFLNAVYSAPGGWCSSVLASIGLGTPPVVRPEDHATARTDQVTVLQKSVIFLARGASVTVYACTFDKNKQYLYGLPGVWSVLQGGQPLGAITPDCLVPAPDGLCAVFTAPNGVGEAFLKVEIPGYKWADDNGVVVVVD